MDPHFKIDYVTLRIPQLSQVCYSDEVDCLAQLMEVRGYTLRIIHLEGPEVPRVPGHSNECDINVKPYSIASRSL